MTYLKYLMDMRILLSGNWHRIINHGRHSPTIDSKFGREVQSYIISITIFFIWQFGKLLFNIFLNTWELFTMTISGRKKPYCISSNIELSRLGLAVLASSPVTSDILWQIMNEADRLTSLISLACGLVFVFSILYRS